MVSSHRQGIAVPLLLMLRAEWACRRGVVIYRCGTRLRCPHALLTAIISKFSRSKEHMLP